MALAPSSSLFDCYLLNRSLCLESLPAQSTGTHSPIDNIMIAPPLPTPDPTEPPHWTEPILSEETRARLEHFRQLGWLPPNYKPRTLQGLAVVEGYWRR